MMRESLRIANCSGFFGDRQSAAREMVESADPHILTGDWLAELTMLILHKQMARDPLKGFASTFIGQVEQVLGTCLDRGIRIVSNAGGMNPEGCAVAVRAVAERLGLEVKVGTVAGDDLSQRAADLARAGKLRRIGATPGFSTDFAPMAANAYLGGWGIASCLDAGADVVVTGRVTDAALVVGPCAWAFGWRPDDWDALAGAVVAGHVIECGAQATGGNYSFFDELGDMTRLGFPLAEVYPDGSSVITKARGNNGTVSVETVTAQLLYEVGAPTYLNPDVTALIDSVRVAQVGPDQVSITGVRGLPPPRELKVSMAVEGGYRNDMTLVLTGLNAKAKAAAAEAAIWEMIPGGKSSFEAAEVELLGSSKDDPQSLGEAVSLLRLAVSSQDRTLAGRTFSSAVVQTGLASYPGFFMTTPPGPAAEFATFIPGLVDAAEVEVVAAVDGNRVIVATTTRASGLPHVLAPGSVDATSDWGPTVRQPLGLLCGSRSGDKGGIANIGLWVREPGHYRWLRESLTVEAMSQLLPDGGGYRIERFEFPNLSGLNFVVHAWLGDGVSSSLRFDSQAKGLGEYVRSRHWDLPLRLMGGAGTEP